MAAINPDHRDRHSFAQSFSREGYSLDSPAKQRPEIPHIDSKTKAALQKEWDDLKLPFTLTEVFNDWDRCKKLLTKEDWENKVEMYIMKITYHSDIKHKLTDRLDLTVFTLDDTHVAREVESVWIIARLFDEIRGMLFDDFANGGNFELQWMQLHPEIRTALMYSALHGAACGTDLPRYNCPDITVALFARDDPKALLVMMRQVVQSAIDHPHKNDYYPIACEEFDKAHSIDRNSKTGGAIPIERSRRGAQTIQVNRRHEYIAHFLHAMLFIHGHGPHGISGPQQHEFGALLLKVRTPSSPETQKLQGKNKRRTNIAEKAKCACAPCLENQQTIEDEIEVCECCQRKLPDCGELVRFLYCSKCLALSPPRRYAYCSRDCQAADYKKGAHREVCGKPVSEWSTDLATTPRPSAPLSLFLQWMVYEINQNALKVEKNKSGIDSSTSSKELIYIVRSTYQLSPLIREIDLIKEDDVEGQVVDEKGAEEEVAPHRRIYYEGYQVLHPFHLLKPYLLNAVINTPPSPANLNKLIRLLAVLFDEPIEQLQVVLMQVWEDFDKVIEWDKVIQLAEKGLKLERQWMWNVLHQAEGFYDEIC